MSEISTGRGGAGNIGHGTQQYTDGEIHREGHPDASGGAYSTGRGGAFNIASSKQIPTNAGDDVDVVPDQSIKMAQQEGAISTGRGGEGNIVEAKDIDGKLIHHKTLGEKLKELVHHEHNK